MAPPARPTSPAALRFHRDRFPGNAAYDTAISHAMLRRVGAGELPESLRLYQPDRVLLFSTLDARREGYPRAIEIARAAGFDVALRLAGGHAAAFLDESMAFAWAIPEPDSRAGIHERFDRLAGRIVAALRRLDLDARVGEVPGEYCPGEYSVHVVEPNGGRRKVMGVGQRVIRGAAHVGGVLTVGQTDLLREVLIPVYEALDIEFRPETAGGVSDTDPSIGVEDVVASMREGLEAEGFEVQEAEFDAATARLAEELQSHHQPDPERRVSSSATLRATSGGKALLQTDRVTPREERDRSE